MVKYVDGFILPVPKKNFAKYKKMAQLFGKICMEHGAVEYVECIADDVKKGKVTSFPQSVKLKTGETVIFAYAIYKSRAHRNAVTKKVMKDARVAKMMDSKKLPFDGKRMFWGGFKAFISLK